MRSRAKQLRIEASARMIEVWRRDGGRCRFCGEPVVIVRFIPPAKRLSQRGHLLRYRLHTGLVREELIASIEHLTPISAGGRSTMENMALSCVPCNYRRNEEFTQRAEQ